MISLIAYINKNVLRFKSISYVTQAFSETQQTENITRVDVSSENKLKFIYLRQNWAMYLPLYCFTSSRGSL
jgi:hypothetical protein